MKDLAAGPSEEERLVGGREIAPIARFEAEEILIVYDLDVPESSGGGAVAFLGDALLVVVGYKVFVMVAAQTHHFRPREKFHWLTSLERE